MQDYKVVFKDEEQKQWFFRIAAPYIFDFSSPEPLTYRFTLDAKGYSKAKHIDLNIVEIID